MLYQIAQLAAIDVPEDEPEISYSRLTFGLTQREQPANNECSHFYHRGYFGYLELAWRYHLGVIISPQIIWHTVLCRVAERVKNNSSRYESIFTAVAGKKQEISVPTSDPTQISVELLVEHLRRKIPVNINSFFPRFSDSCLGYELASKAVFCDIVSPYYDYSTYMCGIPSITVLGTPQDYRSIVDAINSVQSVLGETNSDYWSEVVSVVLALELACQKSTGDTVSFMKDMFRLKPCGSGSQNQAKGWLLNVSGDKQNCQTDGLLPCIGTVKYTNIETQLKFAMSSGILRSTLTDGILYPEWQAVTFEDLKPAPPQSLSEMKITSTPIAPKLVKLSAKWTT